MTPAPVPTGRLYLQETEAKEDPSSTVSGGWDNFLDTIADMEVAMIMGGAVEDSDIDRREIEHQSMSSRYEPLLTMPSEPGPSGRLSYRPALQRIADQPAHPPPQQPTAASINHQPQQQQPARHGETTIWRPWIGGQVCLPPEIISLPPPLVPYSSSSSSSSSDRISPSSPVHSPESAPEPTPQLPTSIPSPHDSTPLPQSDPYHSPQSSPSRFPDCGQTPSMNPPPTIRIPSSTPDLEIRPMTRTVLISGGPASFIVYTCPLCDREFSSWQRWEHHVECHQRFHAGLTPFSSPSPSEEEEEEEEEVEVEDDTIEIDFDDDDGGDDDQHGGGVGGSENDAEHGDDGDGGGNSSPVDSDLENDYLINVGNSPEESDVPIDGIPSNLGLECGFVEVETAFLNRLKTYRLGDVQNLRGSETVGLTIPEFLVNMFDRLIKLLRKILHYVTSVKTNLWLDCEFINVHGQTCARAFKTRNVAVYRTTDLEEFCGDLFQKLVDEKEACEMKGSGWTFVRINDLEVRVNVHKPLAARSFVPLPPEIASKRAVLNVHNIRGDNMCFKYAILSRYVDNPHRHVLRAEHFTANVEARANLDFSQLTYPVSIGQISTFEKQNDVSINVYGLEKVRGGTVNRHFFRTIVYPLRVTKEENDDPRRHFDLLYLTDDETTHYALITDFSRLVRAQITAHNGRLYICKRCFAHFDDQLVAKGGLSGARRLNEHKVYCKEHLAVRTDLPEKKTIRFEKHERTQKVRFTIYADFECALVPIERGDGNVRNESPPTVPPPAWDPANTRPGLPHHRRQRAAVGDCNNADSASVTTHHIHKPYAYAYYVHDSEYNEGDDHGDVEIYTQFRTYKGDDAAQHFMWSLRNDVRGIGDVLYANRQLRPQLTNEEETQFQAATVCYLCNKTFPDPDEKVRDHQHHAPYRYRGAAHRECNLRFKEQDMVNCYFHNLSNYDAHFVVRELGLDGGNVSVLANTEEKFISFTKRFEYPNAGRHKSIGVRFLDSYRFLSKALSALVEILPPEKLINTRRFFPDPEQLALVTRKGVFPYEYVTSLAVLREGALPPPAAFRDSLRMEDVKADDYAHAQRVWAGFNCETLADYAEVYLKTDVVLLADVFESFREMCMQHYHLDPAHWITIPSYAWDVMLKLTGVTLDLLQDIDMYLFFEKGIRGGLTQCVTRHVVANNKFTRREGDSADGHFDDTYTMYYDANNLYGWAMSQKLPCSDFRWLTPEEIAELDVLNIDENSEVGYVLEVDLEYPRNHELHDRHRDLPFCPELRKAPAEQLPYPAQIVHDFNVGKSAKLMATLLDKEHYVIHYRSLQQALENGLRIRRVHRVVRFRQSSWLQPYVQLNTELRRQARNKFEVELFKLMVNAVYGMSLQNVRKHISVRLATNPVSYTKYVAKPNFRDRTWYREDLALVDMAKVRIVLDKPVFVGMSILDHSKWWMYRFHYNMLDWYGGADHIRLVYQDTDSLIYSIRTRDVYQDMLNHLDDFDTSNYPRNHKCYDARNARVLGKFKDEADGKVIKEFIGLMSKLYCISFVGHESNNDDSDDDNAPPPIKRAKGVNRAVVSRSLTLDDYRRCLFEQRVRLTENERFQSRHHKIYSVSVRKRSLAPFDDKRYVVPEDGGVSTLPWGHYRIPEQEEDGDM